MFISVILRASRIPEYSTVAKVLGSKEYVLRDSLKIYTKGDSEPRELKAEKGTRLLVDREGNANSILEDVELKWIVDVNVLKEFLEKV
jgi:hypothetical protein